MLVLAIESATLQGGVALARVPGLSVEIMFERGMVHGRDMAQAIDSLLQEQSVRLQNLDLIVCDIGPGSYTGLRVGLAYARTLCWALSKPIVGVASLDALARQYARAHPDLADGTLLAPAIDAKWNQVYHALYEVRAGVVHRLKGPYADPPDQAFCAGPSRVVFGDALESLLSPKDLSPSVKVDPDPSMWFPKPLMVLELGALKFNDGAVDNLLGLEPLYLRPTEAELKRVKPT